MEWFLYKAKWFPLWGLFLCFGFGITATQGADAKPMRVLLLHSYHQGLSWSDEITEAVNQELLTQHIELCVEYLDSKRHPLNDVAEDMAQSLATKYREEPPAVIITADNNALEFLRPLKNDLFPQTPVVFCGINQFNPELLEGFGPDITGVIEKVDPAGTVNTVLKLLPDTSRLVLITGSTPTARSVRDECVQALRPYQDRMELDWWDGLQTDDLLDRLSQLGEGDAVLLILFNRDGAGTYYSYEESAQMIAEGSPVPVFGLWNFYMNTGLAGGQLANAAEQGRMAAQMAKSILNGDAAATHPVIEMSPNEDIYDWNALKRHNLDPDRLPPTATVLNRPQTATARWALLLGWGLVCLLFVSGLTVATWLLYALYTSRRGMPTFASRITFLATALPLLAVLPVVVLWTGYDYLAFRDRTNSVEAKLQERAADLIVGHVNRTVHFIAQNVQAGEAMQRGRMTNAVNEVAAMLTPMLANAPVDAPLPVTAINTLALANKLAGPYTFFLTERTAADRSEQTGKPSDHTNLRAIPGSPWLLGAKLCHDKLHRMIDRRMIRHIETIKYHDGEGHISVIDTNGTIIADGEDPSLQGTHAINMKDSLGRPSVRNLLQIVERSGHGFMTYSKIKPSTGLPAEKMVYAKRVPGRPWVVASGLYVDEILSEAATTRQTLRHNFAVSGGLSLALTSLLCLGAFLLSRHISKKLNKQFGMFENSLRHSIANNSDPENEWRYREFCDLAHVLTGLLAELRDARIKVGRYTERQRVLLDNIPTQIFFLTDATTYGEVNRAHAEFQGRTVEELSDRPLHELFPDNIVKFYQESNASVFRDGKTVYMEEWATNAQGEQRLLSIVKTAKKGADGEIEYVVAAATDITESRQDRIKLESALADLHRAQRLARMGSWTRQLETGKATWSDETYQLLGLDPNTAKPLMQDDYQKMIHPDDRDKFRKRLHRMIHSDATSFQEAYRIIRADNEVRYIQAVTEIDRDEAGRALCIFGTIMDVTELQKARKGLREERALFVTGPSVVFKWIPEPEWHLNYVSPNVEALLGYTADELLALRVRFQRWIHPDDFSKWLDAINACVADSTIPHTHQRYRLRRRDGSYTVVDDYSVFNRSHGGVVTSISGYLMDRSEQALTEEKLRVTLANAERLNRAMLSREHRMMDIKLEINTLCRELGRPVRYPAAERTAHRENTEA